VTDDLRTAVLTVVAGRHEHLRRQLAGLRAGTVAPDLLVVVAMGDADVADVVRAADLPWPWRVVDVDVPSGGLPLAAARNRAVAEAREEADVLVLLDVDCIPDRRLVERYRDVAAQVPGPSPALLCGVVRYLPALATGEDYDLDRLDASARPHPARPAVGPGELVRADDLLLFWSLSFAVRTEDLTGAVGFDEAFVGYGGEDTDLAMQVQAAGGSMWWVGGAEAYHQHHDSEVPPVRHAEAIARNAEVFRGKWGWYPMQGWLDALRDEGVLVHGPDGWRPAQASADSARSSSAGTSAAVPSSSR
jgi:GT2 family glycosyltransferase